MALSDPKKKGGPHTKQEKENRQNEVYRLHFEYGYSAVKIAEMVNAHRNTVNEDIKFHYSNFLEDSEGFDTESLILKQTHRLDSQRSLMREELDNVGESKDKINLGIKLSELDLKILQQYMKIQINKKQVIPDVDLTINVDLVTDDLVEDVLRHLVKSKGGLSAYYRDGEMTREIIEFLKCDVSKTEKIISRMNSMGLKYCVEPSEEDTFMTSYNLSKFVKMRGL